MTRHILRLVALAAIAIAAPQVAQAFDADDGPRIKLAMGPMSAPLKNQGTQTAAADPPVVTAPRPYHRNRHKSSVR